MFYRKLLFFISLLMLVNGIALADISFPETYYPNEFDLIGSEACKECHPEEVELWQQSHHAHANRPIDQAQDKQALLALPDSRATDVAYRVVEREKQLFLSETSTGKKQEHAILGVIGFNPLRQLLVELPGGRYQALNPGYDIGKSSWIDVFENDPRQPGDWGHWQGQGMNWNANCVWCHMTGYEKRFDFEKNSYNSTWLEQGVGCATCHSDLQNHVRSARSGGKIYPTRASPADAEAVCASCHSRRDSLSADVYRPGDPFTDHFRLMTAAQPGLYYADGQIKDEVFVYGSFVSSSMHLAGVTCRNCHDPHSGKTLLAVENNSICQQCHQSGVMGAPRIEPAKHSFHRSDSSGSRCVNCHMPKTTYMGSDPRADHGFLKPDPLMTRKLGIPNACSNCHDDKPLEWVVRWSEKWYGKRLALGRQKTRTQALAQAWHGEPTGLAQLLSLQADESNNYWRAVYSALLGSYLPDPGAVAALRRSLDDDSPLVRVAAIEAWSQLGSAADPAFDKHLDDETRLVRLTTAWNMLMTGHSPGDQPAWSELRQYFEFHRDRPQALLSLALLNIASGTSDKVSLYINRAVELDKNGAEAYHQGAILLSMAGEPSLAEQLLARGLSQFPDNSIFPFSLGLLAAEGNDLTEAVRFLQRAVELEPQFGRAWENLARAYRKQGRYTEADRAMAKARRISEPASNPNR